MEKKMVIGFSIGDINGIGPEVLIKALQDNRLLHQFTPVVYASNKVMSFYKKTVDTEHFKFSGCQNVRSANPKLVNVIHVLPEDMEIEPGKETHSGGQAALLSLEAATTDLFGGNIDALVTCPINKHNMREAGFAFHGHTEYFNSKAGNPAAGNLMMLLNDGLRVALATHHIPLEEVAVTLTQDLLFQKLHILHQSLISDFGCIKPVIAVTGLNPHASDQGLMGKQEKEVIIPVIQKMQEMGRLVVGPFAADGLFGSGQYKQFDAVMAMYHDQGLVGFKALSFESGTNFTAGLPFVRTSPDHGTAYDIAGRNKANAGSILQAIFTAIDIVRNRKNDAEMRQNPVKRQVIASERG